MSKHVTKGKLEMVELGEERGRIQIKVRDLKLIVKKLERGLPLLKRKSRIWKLGPRTSEHERSYEKSAVNRYSGILNTKKSEEILRRKGSIMIRLGGVKNSKLEGCF
ncbi:hypothetical protein V1477_019438 [Vespula maculifrons]|uniref:Uncharacterized protein n=1 Tax=Vespula maculifrons TaxID=7453 RepID=A0ABD2ASH8_VESMC